MKHLLLISVLLAVLPTHSQTLNHFGEWEGDCLPYISIGKGCCSTAYQGIPISTTKTRFTHETFLATINLKKNNKKVKYLEIRLNKSSEDYDRIQCTALVYELDIDMHRRHNFMSFSCQLIKYQEYEEK